MTTPASQDEWAPTQSGMASGPSTLASLVPLVLGQPGSNTTFVLDRSADMSAALESVKELLVQTLVSKASHRDSLFNIVSFSGQVSCWSPRMRPCTAHSVYTALCWIRSITCGPGKDFLSAVTLALADPSCQAVQLLSAAMPEQAAAVLRVLPHLACGRPVNVFYLLDAGRQPDAGTRDYLHALTGATRGRCYVIPVDHSGGLDQPVPLQSADNTCPVWSCCPISDRLPAWSNTTSPPFRRHLLHPSTSCVLPAATLSTSEFFPGCRVLARKDVDAFYYLATVIQRVQGLAGVWAVEFDCTGSAGLGAEQQLVCTADMIKHCGTSLPSLRCGDAVLSPWEAHLRRYGPGRVTSVRERGGHLLPGEVQSLVQVQMWNTCVCLLPPALVRPITTCRYSTLVLELRSTGSAHKSPEGRRRCDSTRGHDGDVMQAEVTLPSSDDDDDDEGAFLPAVKRRASRQRPPWRYWKRTGPEPQHTQPVRTSSPARSNFFISRTSASPNHSSRFQSLPGSKLNHSSVL
ncbi:uncharacterized protein C11orf16 homolog isoform X1 [Entelurus aequoreus]|uniref:uncharacterized protein C11orf16 homolog isoform X1 n=1 Tax=Entelurus aequoreus TaxID=161455 RepID=UPI002B1DA43D|nr:uncharacterized protein C11orf16 homolog isoform X1 [Entelurus aequoreus]